jgi:hypothetical protein
MAFEFPEFSAMAWRILYGCPMLKFCRREFWVIALLSFHGLNVFISRADATISLEEVSS